VTAARDYEAEYNNSRRVPEFPAIAARWQSASNAYRRRARARLDVPYGAGERQRYDLFETGEAAAPLLVYLHGGYWQEGDRTLYAHLADAFNARGVRVAIPSYSLCPAVEVAEIVAEIQRFLGVLWRETSARPLLVGHSAGGHLTAAMLATDWTAVPEVPGDLIAAGVPISGVFDLEPLVTTSINRALRLDRERARRVSPLRWPRPAGARTVLAVVGAEESAEFRRQSRELCRQWAAPGWETECLEVAGANHFTVIDELARAGSALQERVLALARERSP